MLKKHRYNHNSLLFEFLIGPTTHLPNSRRGSVMCDILSGLVCHTAYTRVFRCTLSHETKHCVVVKTSSFIPPRPKEMHARRVRTRSFFKFHKQPKMSSGEIWSLSKSPARTTRRHVCIVYAQALHCCGINERTWWITSPVTRRACSWNLKTVSSVIGQYRKQNRQIGSNVTVRIDYFKSCVYNIIL